MTTAALSLSLAQIRENDSYIGHLNSIIKDTIRTTGQCSLRTLIQTIHGVCPELGEFCRENQEKFKVSSVRDKGLIGKIVEFQLFGNLPNNDSCPDMQYGDIKTTHFKSLGNGKAFNAKERLTLTNFGDPEKQANIDTIADKATMQDTRFYEKIKRGIILIFQQESVDYDTIDCFYDKKILGVVFYNLDELFVSHPDVQATFQDDFVKIKTCVLAHAVSQKGQQYLHMHKHGCKAGATRAFGFTNKFLTRLVSIYLEVPLVTQGRSEYISF